MAKRTYSIRKGFEYQDLVCANKILGLIEDRKLALEFKIESDEVQFVDDLQIFPPDGVPIGHQIKFHVNRAHLISFDDLCKRKSTRHKSLLQKLLVGWTELSNDGEKECEIEFISTGYPEQDGIDFAVALSTGTDTISPEFYSEARFTTLRDALCEHLKVDLDKLRFFLDAVRWRLGEPSLDVLNRQLGERLRRLRLPHNATALLCLRWLVGIYAVEVKERKTIYSFMVDLAQIPEFREACEQHFPEINAVLGTKRRASSLTVATVSIKSLPAFSTPSMACLEEPAIPSDYQKGVTVPDLAGEFDQEREAWLREYSAWQLARIRQVLNVLSSHSPDLVVFPRFAITFDIALEIFEWCRERGCNAAIGGFSLGSGICDLDDLDNFLGTKHWPLRSTTNDPHSCIADVILRHDRVGRAILSKAESPFSRNEDLRTNVCPIELNCSDGWVTAAVLPTSTAVQDFCRTEEASPELIISPIGFHHDSVCSELLTHEQFHGIPIVVSSLDSNIRPHVGLLKEDFRAPTSQGDWEGINVSNIAFDRQSGSRWTAQVETLVDLPIVYDDAGSTDRSDSVIQPDKLRGATGSITQVQRTIDEQPDKSVEDVSIVFSGEDPYSFFLRRLEDAIESVRHLVGNMSTSAMSAAIRALAEMESNHEELRRVTRTSYVPMDSPVTIPVSVSRSLIDRGDETRSITKFVGGATEKRILQLFGPKGVGKRAILSHVRQVTPRSDKWIEIRAISDSPLTEMLAQILMTLGVDVSVSPELSVEIYDDIWQRLKAEDCPLLVITEAENLPLYQDQLDHADLGAFLAAAARAEYAHPTRLLLVSTSKGHLAGFAGSHLMEGHRIKPLSEPDTLRLLQDLLSAALPPSGMPAASDLEILAKKIHGYPLLADIAVSLLQRLPVAELIDKLHDLPEVRSYVSNALLQRTEFSRDELDFLGFCSILRIPVRRSAFAHVAGATSRALIRVLTDRLMLTEESGRLRIHPLIAEHFRTRIDSDAERRFHRLAFRHLDDLCTRNVHTLDEEIERIFHAMRCGQSVHLQDYRVFTGPIRTALRKALTDRDYGEIAGISGRLLEVVPDDPVATIAKAVADDASGRKVQREDYEPVLTNLLEKDLWIAVELIRSQIRRRDFDTADEMMTILERRYGERARIKVVRAQLLDRQGRTDDAVAICADVLNDANVHAGDAFSAAIILRHANELALFVQAVDNKWDGTPPTPRLLRLYAYGCVVTNHDPARGLKILQQMWADHSHDGRVVADFACALAWSGNKIEAERLFVDGLESVGFDDGRKFVLEEYALFLATNDRLSEANVRYRELVRLRSLDLHILRRFARSLVEESRTARNEGESILEKACLDEASRMIANLLEIAPLDPWAIEFDQSLRERRHN